MSPKSRTHTHTGECQICGRIQAVRVGSNIMAKHGYTVACSMFSGTCWGADHLPLQISKDLLDKAIQMSRDRIVNLQESIQAERDANTLHGYVSVWIKGKGYAATGHYCTVACEFRGVTVPYASGDGSYERVEAFALRDNPIADTHAGKQVKYDNYGAENAKAAALKSREQLIAELQGYITRYESYIAWQEGRKRDWAPRELTPVAPEPAQRVFQRGDVLKWRETQITLTRPATGTSGQHTGWWVKAHGRDREIKFSTRELRALTNEGVDLK